MTDYQDPKWQSGMRIRFDFNNMMSQVLGKHGLTVQEIKSLDRRLQTADRAIKERRSRDPVGERLAWMDSPYQAETVEHVLTVAQEIRSWCDTFVILGIGGSALGAKAVHSALNSPLHNLLPPQKRNGPRLFILDNIDPDWLGEMLDFVDLPTTCFNVISKSGSTAETMSQFLLIRQTLIDQLGKKSLTKHLLITTDASKGTLRSIAEEEDYTSFVVPDGVGGRFSVLSPVGLVPLAVIGVDIRELLVGAAYADQLCQEPDIWKNSAYMNATLQYLAYQKGRTLSVIMPYVQALSDVADWYRQLCAESLGKRYGKDGSEIFVGLTPVKALGPTDQHSQMQLYREGPFDKVVNFITAEQYQRELPIPSAYVDHNALGYLGTHTMNELIQVEQQATALALADAGRMNCAHILPEVNAFTVGQLLYILEVQTAFSGELFAINTFDQPGVEGGKAATYALLGRPGYKEQRREIEAKLKNKNQQYII